MYAQIVSDSDRFVLRVACCDSTLAARHGCPQGFPRSLEAGSLNRWLRVVPANRFLGVPRRRHRGWRLPGHDDTGRRTYDCNPWAPDRSMRANKRPVIGPSRRTAGVGSTQTV